MKLLFDLLYNARILEVRGTTHVAVEHIALDSRQVKPLGLFVAIEGSVVDGHAFIDQAIQAGAACVICERMPEDTPEHVTVVQVKSSAAALGQVAAAFYDHPSKEMKVVAVTGTNGKTTTVTLIASALSTHGSQRLACLERSKTGSSIGSFRRHTQRLMH